MVDEEEEEEEEEIEEEEEEGVVAAQIGVAAYVEMLEELLRGVAPPPRRLKPLRPPGPEPEIPYEELRRREEEEEVKEGYKCPYCGGPVNTLTGICESCGAKVW